MSNLFPPFSVVCAIRTSVTPRRKVRECGLATDILMVLGINEYGTFVGREALGLA